MQKQLKTAAHSKMNPCCVGLWVSDIVSTALLKNSQMATHAHSAEETSC